MCEANYKNKCVSGFSAIILAGGKSRRMGQDKACLDLRGKTFLQYQADKLKALGISDIIVSGRGLFCEGTRCVDDVYRDCGPLGGIHTGLCAAENKACLILATDIPLLPDELLRSLLSAHKHGITLLSHGGIVEPLIGVYDRDVAKGCEALLQKGPAPVMRFAEAAGYECFEYDGDLNVLLNCNTPADYEMIKKLVEILK